MCQMSESSFYMVNSFARKDEGRMIYLGRHRVGRLRVGWLEGKGISQVLGRYRQGETAYSCML